MWSRTMAVVLMLMVAGCAASTQMRRFTTEAEVLAAYGEPARRWSNDDGTTTLEYSSQPYGDFTLMVTVDQGGIVMRQENALDEENLARVARGMTKEEVSRLLGQHRSVQRFSLSGEEVWDWNIRNEYYSGVVETLFNVHFVDDKVVRTSRTYVYPNDGLLSGPWYGPGFAPPPPHFYPFPHRRPWPHHRGHRHRYASPWYFY